MLDRQQLNSDWKTGSTWQVKNQGEPGSVQSRTDKILDARSDKLGQQRMVRYRHGQQAENVTIQATTQDWVGRSEAEQSLEISQGQYR